MNLSKNGLLLTVIVLVACHFSRAEEPSRLSVDFNRDVRSILSNNCFTCHGPDEAERQASLRLDTPTGAQSPADSGEIAIVPGKPGESELITRITTSDESLRMPPAESGKKLSSKDIQVIEDWIAQGAQVLRSLVLCGAYPAEVACSRVTPRLAKDGP